VGDEAGGPVTSAVRPAFYAVGAGRGGLRDWVTLLHPPYTAWHLSYVAIGAALAPAFTAWRLEGALVAFFLAVGVGAHALDELAGRPLRTGIPSKWLYVAGGLGVGVPVVTGLVWGGLELLPFIVLGGLLVATYNLELFDGALHTPVVFALGWGAFPVLTGYYVQGFDLGWPVLPAAAAAFFLAWAQHALSAPAGGLRDRAGRPDGRDGGADRPCDPRGAAGTRAPRRRPGRRVHRRRHGGGPALTTASVGAPLREGDEGADGEPGRDQPQQTR
jgi:hypothetical protein